MIVLLEWNRLARLADVHFEPLLSRGDRQALVAELADHVKRFARRLLEREPQRIRRDLALDLGAHVGRGLEKPIGRYKTVECLVRPLEVVVLEVVLESLLRVDVVREDRAPEKFVPQGLPEALDLTERLRVLRPTTDVLDPEACECLFEFGLAAPHRVLTTVVRQHFGRLPVRGDAALECLHHQRRLLVMRECVPHDEAAVVVHEHAHVQTFLPAVQKREDVRLPQLVRCRPLEATRLVLARRRRCRCFDQALVVQDPPHRLLGHAERLEPPEDVANLPRAPRFVLGLELEDVFTHDRARCRPFRSDLAAFRFEPRDALRLELFGPLPHGGDGHAERLGDVGLARAA